MARAICPTYGDGSVYGDGTTYCNNLSLPNKYYAMVDANDSMLPQRTIFTIKHSNGSLFSLYTILPHISQRAYRLPTYSANTDLETSDRIILTLKHSNGTAFRLDTIRPHIRVKKKRLVG